MPIVIPVEVQVPQSFEANMSFLQERINLYAQTLVDESVANSRPHRRMTLAEVESKSLSLEESRRRITEMIRHHYHKEA